MPRARPDHRRLPPPRPARGCAARRGHRRGTRGRTARRRYRRGGRTARGRSRARSDRAPRPRGGGGEHGCQQASPVQGGRGPRPGPIQLSLICRGIVPRRAAPPAPRCLVVTAWWSQGPAMSPTVGDAMPGSRHNRTLDVRSSGSDGRRCGVCRGRRGRQTGHCRTLCPRVSHRRSRWSKVSLSVVSFPGARSPDYA